jgi:hypothetical protein
MSKLYEADFYTWARTQAELARRRSSNEFDWDQVAEELEALGASEERELGSRYIVLLQHLLKWIYQPSGRGRSWRATIAEQRRAIAKLLRRNPGLKAREASEFADAYVDARDRASGDTDLDIETFPETPPFTMEDAKSADYWPE